MNQDDFFSELADILEVDTEVSAKTLLKDTEEYDSLAIMSLIAFLDENFEMAVSGEVLVEIKSVKHLIGLIGKDKIVS